jgi:glutathione S-transferase
VRLGKSPVITDSDRTIAESGAIIDYVVRRHGRAGQPDTTSPLYDEYVQWLHYAELGGHCRSCLLYVTWLDGARPGTAQAASTTSSRTILSNGRSRTRVHLRRRVHGRRRAITFVAEIRSSSGSSKGGRT